MSNTATSLDDGAWVLALDQMRATWFALIGDADVVDAWDVQMAELAAEHADLVKQGEWRSGPADFLGVLQQSYRETYHSAVIAWLARPEGHHGLNIHFLRELLIACGPTAEHLLDDLGDAPVHVATEVTSGACRADIIIATPIGRLLIENKTGASEGQDQLRSYYDEFDDGATLFAFLTPRGSAPTTAGDTADVWMCVSYWQVTEALRRALALGDPHSRAAGVARSYLDSLEASFP